MMTISFVLMAFIIIFKPAWQTRKGKGKGEKLFASVERESK